ncbi:NADH dehydrogenase [Bradyrhizobium oligotrophicum S58]|uniref:Probable inorganic carbon transporter subunit DabB n=1 Tax=Bradyrhizobium oligotrophicum S58 TaxID=1245469 RepID=M4ZEX6_9BRAD|nr:NADH-quinone oxidoreductase subunit L [Bradyrhizobium oligotrophicum]BAM92368.1 NADH dehydrogenase [Bradyrhizobium oligotrophicum S58]
MNPIPPCLAALAPLTLCVAAIIGADAGARVVARRAIAAAALAFGITAAASLAAAILGAGRTPLVGAHGLGLSLQLDALGAILIVLVGFIGFVVISYSRNYLDGDPGQVRFTRWLLLTLAAVLTLLISGNLVLLLAAWIATSLALGKLLLFYGTRPAAIRASRKKFVASRLGDAMFALAALLLYIRFGTLEIASLAAQARGGEGAGSALVTIAALLIVATAMLKSAQLPLHGWLIEVMETPTPVSALLHAGIINAGGFLVLRLSDVLLLATPALDVLAVVGGTTALFGSLVMLTQTSVKVQLAYSTVAQMGFMLLQCGLGAFSAALLHIVAHSLYKAHAFLSSGSIIDLARASWTPSPGGQPHAARLILALASVIGLALSIGFAFGMTLRSNPAQIALGSVLLMGLVHLMANAIDERPNAFVVARAAVTALGVAVVYFALQAVMAWLVAGSLPASRPVDGVVPMLIAAAVVVSFAAVTLFQNQMMRRADAPFWIAAYVHLRNGLYLNTLANRLVLTLWPRGATSRFNSNP